MRWMTYIRLKFLRIQPVKSMLEVASMTSVLVNLDLMCLALILLTMMITSDIKWSQSRLGYYTHQTPKTLITIKDSIMAGKTILTQTPTNSLSSLNLPKALKNTHLQDFNMLIITEETCGYKLTMSPLFHHRLRI